MLVIHDEQLANELRQIAEREQRPVEDVLKSMVERYPSESATAVPETGTSEGVNRVRRKAYVKARAYWQSVGDLAKAALTDEELDMQFGAFDEAGIPRLKSEILTEPPAGSLAYAAKVAKNSSLHSGNPALARQSEEILEEHFASDHQKKMRGEDASE